LEWLQEHGRAAFWGGGKPGFSLSSIISWSWLHFAHGMISPRGKDKPGSSESREQLNGSIDLFGPMLCGNQKAQSWCPVFMGAVQDGTHAIAQQTAVKLRGIQFRAKSERLHRELALVQRHSGLAHAPTKMLNQAGKPQTGRVSLFTIPLQSALGCVKRRDRRWTAVHARLAAFFELLDQRARAGEDG
jgi:hypothetical protein